jgi:hypothetical protein
VRALNLLSTGLILPGLKGVLRRLPSACDSLRNSHIKTSSRVERLVIHYKNACGLEQHADSIEAKELPPDSARTNLNSRLVFAGQRWQSIDLCIHGQQLRWHCAECDEYFKERAQAEREEAGLIIFRPAPISEKPCRVMFHQ